jgi:hypothetical protein
MQEGVLEGLILQYAQAGAFKIRCRILPSEADPGYFQRLVFSFEPLPS